MKVSTSNPVFPDIRLLRPKAGPGLSHDPDFLKTGGGNGGFAAVNLAVLLGGRRLLLLGYDLGQPAGRPSHWHGDHPGSLRNTDEAMYATWRAGFEAAMPDIERLGLEMINCSEESLLECLPRRRLDQVLSG